MYQLQGRIRIRLVLASVILLIGLVGVPFFAPGAQPAHAASNGLALTPPMGWNNYNHFGCGFNASIIEQQADAMVSSGLKAAGYQYINIDDCWSAQSRDANGNIVPDPNKFPNGMKAVADYVHSKGLKLGLYADAGTATCSGFPGMYGHEQQDANTYASWGVDYLKVDWCNSTGEDAQTEYTKIGNALSSSGRAIVFSLCEWGASNVWTWGASVGNLWRTTSDISDTWSSMLNNFDSNSAYAAYAGPSGWNDPDMLEVGNGGMSTTEDQTHFSLWAISAAPLILGNDMTNMSASAQSILTNSEVIAVDQDSLGIQGTKVADNGSGLQVWSKKLHDGSVAVVLLNRSGSSSNITVNWSSIGLTGSASVRDIWAHTNQGSFANSYTANVASHGVAMLIIGGGTSLPSPTPNATPTPTPGITPTPGTTPTPTPGITPTPTQTPTSGSSCAVTYTIVSSWSGGFQGGLTISNTGASAINGWSLTFTFANGQVISQGWNGVYTQSGSRVTVTNVAYNGTIAPGATLSSFGFLASWNGTNAVPTSFSLNGVVCK